MDPVTQMREMLCETPCERCGAHFGADGVMLKSYVCWEDTKATLSPEKPCKKELIGRPELPQVSTPATGPFTTRADLDPKNERKVPRKWPPKPETTPPYDAVTNPAHYAQHKIQPLQFIMANNLSYCVGNVIKYVCRYNKKAGLEDLRKAREYIDILIEEESK